MRAECGECNAWRRKVDGVWCDRYGVELTSEHGDRAKLTTRYDTERTRECMEAMDDLD
jgi:hypothetical protein